MAEIAKSVRDLVEVAKTMKNWVAPEVLGAKAKVCKCDPGPYTFYTSPSYGIVCTPAAT